MSPVLNKLSSTEDFVDEVQSHFFVLIKYEMTLKMNIFPHNIYLPKLLFLTINNNFIIFVPRIQEYHKVHCKSTAYIKL